MPNMTASTAHALKLEVLAKCSTTKARTCKLSLPHGVVDTPVFMPVGTHGTLKGLTPESVEDTSCKIMLSNTYHLGSYPGTATFECTGGLHKLMNWKYNLLTDSGGFQMVSLLDLSEITEEGVKFKSPYDGKELLLTPEQSIEIQNSIGADIIMQLDDVVSSTVSGPRVEEAMWRSVRWLDRCIKANKHSDSQNLFAIIQGGLDEKLRTKCVKEMIKRKVPGFAIGGLSGGEAKEHFWKMVTLSTDYLPQSKPIYLMGVGFSEDLVVCSALGCDMFDCVYPTRTARFGTALVREGQIQLKRAKYKYDFEPIDKSCSCLTCKTYSRAFLHSIVTRESVACNLVTLHNIQYQMDLMASIREAIKKDEFLEFIRSYMNNRYTNGNYPRWIVNALASVNVNLE